MLFLQKLIPAFARIFMIALLLSSFMANAQTKKIVAVSKRDTVKIIPKSEWNGVEGRPYKQHVPVQITVHHEGGKLLTINDDAKQRLKNIQTWGMGPDRKWADVPYHLLIAPDGSVLQGRNPLTVGETNTEYDPTGHLLICFLGNYNQQKLDENLLKVLVNLLADQCIKYNISPKEISTHRDHSTQTTCPGDDIYSYFQNGYIVKEVSKLVKEK
ncbi:N-acetylmuramoyl-L-alanine amidase [Nubsella zeaxanthinifaciens]|uniref:N-acetylmuramoyl-L-alanine amidase n=1 Tax=Nubsella zeaxanthinifaciens TaxID=392412 RepID=UPI001300BC29|nr:N-acetylmuramoyl-L-alanine amidase [Nubsella zeaxanthinifaciens]